MDQYKLTQEEIETATEAARSINDILKNYRAHIGFAAVVGILVKNCDACGIGAEELTVEIRNAYHVMNESKKEGLDET